MKGSISHFPSIKRISFNIHPVVLLCLIGCASPEDGSPPALTTTTLTHLDSHSPVDATSLPITHLDHSYQTPLLSYLQSTFWWNWWKRRDKKKEIAKTQPHLLDQITLAIPLQPRVDTRNSNSSILNVLLSFVKVLLKKIFPLGVCKVRQSVIFYLFAKSGFFFSSFLNLFQFLIFFYLLYIFSLLSLFVCF